MPELEQTLQQILAAQPSRITLSAPRKSPVPGSGAAGQTAAPPSGTTPAPAYQKAVLRPVGQGWQIEQFTATQAFHQNVAAGQLLQTLVTLLQTAFTQLAAQTPGGQHSLRISKKGKVLTSGGRAANPPANATGQAAPAATTHNTHQTPTENAQLPDYSQPTPAHDRQKKQPLPMGAVIPPLVDIGVLTADGTPIAAKRDKYRQINRFLELVTDALRSDARDTDASTAGTKNNTPLRIIDFGCGKSSLTFVLYYYLSQVRGLPVQITGLDLRADVVATCNAAAQKYGYQNLRFQVGDIAQYSDENIYASSQDGLPAAKPAAQNSVDMVVTLHACDTATDHALAKAVGWQTQMIFSVPCCQHELNAQMQSDEFAILTRYGIVKERTAALFTDALRANLLTACGYKTQLVEFVGFEHTPKNIMIRAVRTGLPKTMRRNALTEAQRLMDAFGLQPTLYTLLQAQLAGLV